MLFVGIDLAWSTKNGSGVAVIDGDRKSARVVHSGLAFSDEEIVNYVRETVGANDALIAIDAPLIVPNEEGRRVAEVVVGELFRKYDAGAHPANRHHLSQWSGTIRGEEISGLLEKEGFEHSPQIERFERSRKLFEVYPHPSMVVLFNLDRVIPYKAKPKRDYKLRWRAFETYQSLLAGLSKASPSLVVGDVLKTNVRKLRAQKLKDYEDSLDAIFCAYIAYYCWAHPEKCEVLGNMKEGYILTPVFDAMKKQLAEKKTQKMLFDY